MPQTAYHFLVERNDRLAQVLAANPDVAGFVQAVLEHLIDRQAQGRSVELEPPQLVREGRSLYISARIR